MADITMSLDDTLELDAIIQEWNNPSSIISDDDNNFNMTGIQTNTGVLEPQNAGTYNITVNGQTLTVEVTDPYEISNTVQAKNLVAWYRFEDGDARDYASDDEYPNITWGDSTAYNGAVNGATITQGVNGKGFKFDGSNDYIDLPSYPSSVLGSSNRTHCFWIKESLSSDGCPFSHRVSSDSKDYEITFRQPDDKLQLATGGSNRIWNSNSETFDGEWHHHAIVLDGSQNSDLTWYQDASSLTVSSTNNTTLNTGNSQVIGGQTSNSKFFKGIIDDVRVYDKSLTQDEIQTIYDRTK